MSLINRNCRVRLYFHSLVRRYNVCVLPGTLLLYMGLYSSAVRYLCCSILYPGIHCHFPLLRHCHCHFPLLRHCHRCHCCGCHNCSQYTVIVHQIIVRKYNTLSLLTDHMFLYQHKNPHNGDKYLLAS